jgi:site-specific recombinase XerD
MHQEVTIMRDTTLLGPWIRRFLLEHLVEERNLSRNTQQGYRDTLCQLIPFVSVRLGKSVDRLLVVDISSQIVREFLTEVETTRHCSIATRNQRLAAIHALARFVGEHDLEHIDWCAQIRYIPYKKGIQTTVPYLDQNEINALLATPDQSTNQGRHDYALLLFLYNSGARASEAAELTIADFNSGNCSVNILGKGRKQRLCPLWPVTVQTLSALVGQRQLQERVFLNRCGQSMTRYGIHALVERTVRKAQSSTPSLATKRVSPHSIRHSTATHLLRAGNDINTVRAWLGHVSINTTNIYAEIDLEGKAKALAKCDISKDQKAGKRWLEDPGLMAFLHSL